MAPSPRCLFACRKHLFGLINALPTLYERVTMKVEGHMQQPKQEPPQRMPMGVAQTPMAASAMGDTKSSNKRQRVEEGGAEVGLSMCKLQWHFPTGTALPHRSGPPFLVAIPKGHACLL